MLIVENEGLGRSGAKLYAGVGKTLVTATSVMQACYIKTAGEGAKTAMRKLETTLNDTYVTQTAHFGHEVSHVISHPALQHSLPDGFRRHLAERKGF